MDFKLLSERELNAFMGTLKDEEFSEMAKAVRKELEDRKTRPQKEYILEYNGITQKVMAVNYHEAIEQVPVLCEGIIKCGRVKKNFAREEHLVYVFHKGG